MVEEVEEAEEGRKEQKKEGNEKEVPPWVVAGRGGSWWGRVG